jgi:hypothetical protein
MALSLEGDLTLSGSFESQFGNISGSSTSTGSFGRVEGRTDFTNIDIDDDEIPIAKLAEDSVTYVAGTGLGGGGVAALGNSATINAIGGTGITANANDLEIDFSDSTLQTNISGSWQGELSSSALTFTGGGVSGSSTSTGSFGKVIASNLTNNRVVIAGASNELEDDAEFTFDGTTLIVGNSEINTSGRYRGMGGVSLNSSWLGANIISYDPGTRIRGETSRGNSYSGVQFAQGDVLFTVANQWISGSSTSTGSFGALSIGSGNSTIGGSENTKFIVTGNSEYTGNVSGSSTSHLTMAQVSSSGDVVADGDVIAYNSSDVRLKDNIQVIKGSLDKIDGIRGVEFDWNDKSPGWAQERGHDIGVIAQEVQKVVPEIVVERKNGYLGVDYKRLVPLLIESVKELRQEVNDLKKKVS